MSLLDKATTITTPTAHSNGTLHSIKGGSVADFDVVRGSAATRVNAEGLIEDVATNIPRIDYTDSTASILLEPQSTNLIKNSEDFSDASWTKSNSTITANNILSPDGLLTADLLVDNSSNTFHRVQVSQSVTSGLYYSQSIFVKKGTNRYFYLGTNNFSFWDFTFFDLENNVAVNTPLGVTTKVVVLGNGWVKLTATKLANATNFFNFAFGTSDTTTTSYLGDSSGKVHIWGAQLETLSHATSYIPTSGAIATRLADSVTGAGDASTFNSTEGVLYFEMAALANDGTTRRLAISDGGNNNRVSIGYGTPSNSIQFLIQSLGAISVNQTFTLTDVTQLSKVAFKYKENDCSFWIDGVKVGTDTVASMPTGLNQLLFGQGDTSRPIIGKVKSLITFDTALTDAELECLTTI